MLSKDPLERRLQFAAGFLILGLLVEALCLLWKGPLAFLVFLGLGGSLVFAGIIIYLYSLASFTHTRSPD